MPQMVPLTKNQLTYLVRLVESQTQYFLTADSAAWVANLTSKLRRFVEAEKVNEVESIKEYQKEVGA